MNKFYITLSRDEWIVFEETLTDMYGHDSLTSATGWDIFLINLGYIVGVSIDFFGNDHNKNFVRYMFSSEEQKLKFILTYLL